MSILWGNEDGDEGTSIEAIKKKRDPRGRKAGTTNAHTFKAEVGRRFGKGGLLIVEKVESRLREEVANGIVVSGMELWVAVLCTNVKCKRRIEDWVIGWEVFGDNATCPEPHAAEIVTEQPTGPSDRPKRSPGRPLKRRGPGETMTVVQVYGTVGMKESIMARLKPGESVSSWIIGAILQRLVSDTE